MKADLIVIAAQPDTDADRGLHPDQRGLLQGRAIRPDAFGHSQSGGKNSDRGMSDMGEMGVVVVQRMGRRPVYQSSRTGGQLGAAKDRRLGRSAFFDRHLTRDARHRFVTPGHATGDPVQHGEPEDGTQIVGNVGGISGREFGQWARDGHVGLLRDTEETLMLFLVPRKGWPQALMSARSSGRTDAVD